MAARSRSESASLRLLVHGQGLGRLDMIHPAVTLVAVAGDAHMLAYDDGISYMKIPSASLVLCVDS